MYKFIVSCYYWPAGAGCLRLRALTISAQGDEIRKGLNYSPKRELNSLNKLASSIERRRKRRLKVKCEVELVAQLSLLDNDARDPFPSLTFLGETCDLSSEGLGMLLPSTIIDERFCSGENRLNLSLFLPDGVIDMEVSPIRCQRLNGPNSIHGYLLGTEIINVKHRDQFERYLEKLSGLTPKNRVAFPDYQSNDH